jgi:peroxiredoxin
MEAGFSIPQGLMVANLCLLACALVTAQSPDRGGWQLSPRLSRGQELVYKGAYTEESRGQGVQFSRAYRLESRIFVLDAAASNLNVALYTMLTQRSITPARYSEPAPSSVRLELARVNQEGRVAALGDESFHLPLDGPPTLELGAFIEAPRRLLRLNETWNVADAGRPPETWKLLGTEVVNNTRCLRLEGVQQSDDWNRPRADRSSWRKIEAVWYEPGLGIAYKVERTIEVREPAHALPRQRLITRYELQSSIRYPGQLFEDRRREILQTRKFYEAAAPLFPNPTKYGPRPFEVILAKISQYESNEARTPYREALLQVKHRVEAGRRGDLPPSAPAQDPAQSLTAGVGRRAPDFVVTNLLTKESAHLEQWLGRPILMVFYTPSSATLEEVMRFAQRIQETHSRSITVLGFAVSDDQRLAKKQSKDLELTFPILAGRGLRQNYQVEATPKLVVVDADGIVRDSFVGWGPETNQDVKAEIQRCLRAGSSSGKGSESKKKAARLSLPRP